MPWVERLTTQCGLEGRETLARRACKVLAALQAARMGCPFSQGIGLRPQPWARFSRPVGPVGRFYGRLSASRLCDSAPPPPRRGFKVLFGPVDQGLAKSASPWLHAFAPSGQEHRAVKVRKALLER